MFTCQRLQVLLYEHDLSEGLYCVLTVSKAYLWSFRNREKFILAFLCFWNNLPINVIEARDINEFTYLILITVITSL